MPPIPKEPSTRARTNRVAGARTLHPVATAQVPRLPTVKGRRWHRQTKSWWSDVWSSPMAPEYDDSDRHGLFLLAVLVDDFWQEPSKDLAAEIRLQRQCFGLTPIDRRRLQWEIIKTDEAEKRAATNRPAPQVAPEADPRSLLG